ncbi:hypothetical protein C2S53_012304 [Perilla frutescens var. hirtella]|uniref:J domain-containing protein n=1 Tax=Perilla frutescens var. hirtella TaxID=608512 RepID=A0AAD4P2D7_PERFH|nr:hypothetical protein C2S53_012304 [Perilla frutescens var. hirtella]
MESLSRPPHRRKHSTATTNGSSASFSLRSPYDDVLLSRGGKAKFEPHEYAEIFSGSSSIPVLDVSGLNRPEGCRSSDLDYSNIFGGARDGDVALPYDQFFKQTKTRIPANAESSLQERGSLNSSGKARRPSGTYGQSDDGTKQQFNMSFNKTSQRGSDESNGGTHIAQLRAVPGFTHFVDGNPQLQKKEGDMPVSSMQREVSRTWSFDSGTEAITVKGGLSSEKSHVPDKSCNVNGTNLKSQISKVQQPSGLPSGRNDNKDIKQSSLPSSVPKEACKETVGENLPPLFDEELDENSDAAVSIATLKKAIDQAQESIRLAKMIMQKKAEGVKDGPRARRSKGRSKVEDKKENTIEHAPAGLKKSNVMEKNQRLDPTSPMFNGVDGKSAPIPSHSDNLLNAEKAKVETVRENLETANDHGDAFTEVDKEFAPSCSQSSPLETDEKVEVENITHNVVASEAHGEAINFAGSVAAVVLESGKVDIMDNSICSKAKAVPCLEHMETDKETLEQRELTMHQPKESVANNSQIVQELEETPSEEVAKQCQATVDPIKGTADVAEQLERVLNCSGSMQEQEKITHEGGDNLRITLETETPEGSDSIADKGKCEGKFAGHEELYFAEHLTVPKSEFNILSNESRSLAEENMMDQPDIDKKPKNVSEWKDDGQGEKCSDEDENGMVLKEEILWFESELELEEPEEEEMSEREPGIFPGVGEAATKVDMVLDQETDDGKLYFEHEEGSQSLPVENEENKIAIRCMDAAECDAFETIQTGTNNYSEVQDGESPMDVEEINDFHRAAGTSEEHQDKFEFLDSASEKDTSEAFDVHSNDSCTVSKDNQGIDTGTIFDETPESCNADFNNKAEKYQAVPSSCEESCNLPRETEIFLAVEDNEAGKQLHLELNKMPGTDSKCASVEMFTESQGNNTFEGFSLDGKSTSVILMSGDHEKTLPEDEDMFKTTTEMHHAAQEYAANTNMQNLPELHVSTSNQVQKIDHTNVKPDVQQDSESSEESQLSSTLENIDEVSAHESRDNAKDITPGKEEVTDDLEVNSDERVHVGQQSECLNSEDQSHLSQTSCKSKEMDKSVEAEREIKTGQNMEMNVENLGRTSTSEQKDAKGNEQKGEMDDHLQRIEAIKRGREREKDRIAVERAIREARERAFVEARERAERAAVERAAAEARQRVAAEARERAAVERARAERAAVERATAEARERALEKAMSQKTSMEARVQAAKSSTDRFSSSSLNNGLKHSSSSSDLEKSDGATSESAQRRNARLERHQRLMERSAKALAEKNIRDILAQKEQAERNRLAESLDADIKRWATGKEGNLRALLSTLQYILGPDSGWQPVTLTEIVTTPAVKKAYRKATLCVHPDKLQQRGASIQQKYICEKIFDLLKAAWNRFNSEEN